MIMFDTLFEKYFIFVFVIYTKYNEILKSYKVPLLSLALGLWLCGCDGLWFMVSV
jgi:hypothetical protein